jgi:hypothetical protein
MWGGDGSMRKSFLLIIACAFVLTVASVPKALCYPPAGLDYLPSTTATILLEISGPYGFNETIVANGPTVVARGTPYDPGDGHIKIDTEIVSMQLTGTSVHVGPIVITESASRTSNGAIQQLSPGVDFPASSFFDVFVDLRIDSVHITLHNDDPAFMTSTIYGIPPWGATYYGPPNPVPLRNESGYTFGSILHVSHKIEFLPAPVGGFAVSATGVLTDGIRLETLYIGSISAILVATVGAAAYINHAKHGKVRIKGHPRSAT